MTIGRDIKHKQKGAQQKWKYKYVQKSVTKKTKIEARAGRFTFNELWSDGSSHATTRPVVDTKGRATEPETQHEAAGKNTRSGTGDHTRLI